MVAGSLASEARGIWQSAERLELVVWRLLLAFVFCVPWSIFASQLAFFAVAIAAARHWWLVGKPPIRTPLNVPIAAFLASGVLAAFLGLDVSQGLWGLRTYLQVAIVFIVYRHVRTEERMLRLVHVWLAGMVLTTSVTAWNALTPWALPRVFPGGMTQSGQLVFGIGLAAALAIAGVGGRLVPASLALYTVALLANLKRGAWLGTFAALATIGLVRSRRLILAALAVVIGAVLFVTPVRDRVEATTRDFFLPGSRYDIWSAAVDVIQRFPMGVGRKNGTILRDYPNIPQRHRHAHNNVLQVTMENGFLGLATFLWWMGRFGVLTFGVWRRLPPERQIARAISVAVFADFIGFHVAGLVEFNFGDTEVLQVLFVTMGLGLATAELAGLTARTRHSTNS